MFKKIKNTVKDKMMLYSFSPDVLTGMNSPVEMEKRLLTLFDKWKYQSGYKMDNNDVSDMIFDKKYDTLNIMQKASVKISRRRMNIEWKKLSR